MTEHEAFCYDKEYDIGIISYNGTTYNVTDNKGRDLYKIAARYNFYLNLWMPLIIVSIVIMSCLGGYIVEKYINYKWELFLFNLFVIGLITMGLWNCGKKISKSYYKYRLIIGTSLNSDNKLIAKKAYNKNKFTLIVNSNFK